MSDYEPGYDDDVVYEDAPAQSSIAGPLIRALLAAAVAFGVYALVFGGIGSGGDLELGDDIVVATPTTPPAEAASPSPIPLEPQQPNGEPGTEPDDGAEEPVNGATGEVGAGVTIQVIAGANTTGDQVSAAAAALRELGYDVTETGSISPNAYPETTVFATAGEEALADVLRDADPRFGVIRDNPGNLNPQIQLHVLVGEDWPI